MHVRDNSAIIRASATSSKGMRSTSRFRISATRGSAAPPCAANIPVSASLIATIPFIYASERITFMLDDIRASVKWPEVFEGEQYVNDKKTFDELAAKLRQETAGGEVSAKSLREARDFVRTFGTSCEPSR